MSKSENRLIVQYRECDDTIDTLGDIVNDFLPVAQPLTLLEKWGSETPHAPFFSDGTQTLSYSQALHFVTKLQATLRAMGIRAGDTVGLELPTGLHITFMCALMRDGVTSLAHREPHASNTPSFTADWLLSTQRSESVAAHRVVQVDANFLKEIDQQPTTPLTSQGYTSQHSLVRIVFSSGTTGVPKPIPLTLEMVHHRALAAAELFEKGTQFLSMLDLATASGFHTCYASLMNGTCYFNPGDGQHNLHLIQQFSITAVKASPAQLTALVKAAHSTGTRCDSLRAIYSAGSVLSPTLLTALQQISGAKVYTLYGSTEAGRCAQRLLNDHVTHNVGHVVPGTQVRIVDDAGEEVEHGSTGHIHYRREYQATHYLHDEETTSRVFQDGWFNTGDLGYFNESDELMILGRAGEVVNVAGVKISLVELDTLAQQISGVQDAAGFLVPDEHGIDQIGLALVVSRDANMHQIVSELRQHLGSRSPQIMFSIPKVPRNDAGKVLRQELSHTYQTSVGS